MDIGTLIGNTTEFWPRVISMMFSSPLVEGWRRVNGW